MSLRILGILIVPAIALLFAWFMVMEQHTGRFRASTRNYATGLGVLIAVFAVLSAAGDLLKLLREQRAAAAEVSGGVFTPEVLRLTAFLLATVGFIAALPYFGYLVSFMAYMAAILLVIGYRPYWKLALIAVLVTAFVHVFFVMTFSLPLPRGYLFTGIMGQ